MADDKDEVEPSPDIHFEPIIQLPEVEVKTLEEDEKEILKVRARLFRYHINEEESPEWKERGTGDCKILKHPDRGTFRVLMRRDKTLKICANHMIDPYQELKPNCGSDRAWVYKVIADYADGEPKEEMLAIRFANSEVAKLYKSKFEECQAEVKENFNVYIRSPDSSSEDEDEQDSKTESDNEVNQSNDAEVLTKQMSDLQVNAVDSTTNGSPAVEHAKDQETNPDAAGDAIPGECKSASSPVQTPEKD